MSLENKTPNTITENMVHDKKDQKLNSILNWNKILDFGQNHNKSKRRRKNSKSFHKQKSPLFSDKSVSSSVSPALTVSSDDNQTKNSSTNNRSNNALKRISYLNQRFGVNRVYFEEFPVYRKEFLNPKNYIRISEEDDDVNNIREEIKLVSRYKNNRDRNNSIINYFQDKRVCLIDNDEYLFHSRNQLLLKLEWYGAKVLNYYSSRTDYVICSSSYKEVFENIIKLRNNEVGESEVMLKVIEKSKNTLKEDKISVASSNLRGVNMGQQIKLTEIELLEFLGEEFEIAINSLNISKKLDTNRNMEVLCLTRPKTIWDVTGNKDSMDELYISLLNLRIQSEDLTFLSSIGLKREMLFGSEDKSVFNGSISGGRNSNVSNCSSIVNNCVNVHYYEELCGIYLCISPNNIGAQVCSELTAIGCGYEVKLYKGSDVVDPIIKQWKKGHFFKIFSEVESSPPLCTIMSDCSNVIKPSDLIKVRNSYYNSVSMFQSDVAYGKEKRTGLKSSGVTKNPGAIIFVLEEASEIGQYILNHCNGSNRSYGCSRSYTLYKLDGAGVSNSNSSTGFINSQKGINNSIQNSIKVIKFKELSKSSVLCKLFTKFGNPLLINALIAQFGSNLLKISNILHWIHLIEYNIKGDMENVLKTLSLYYSPVLFDSTIETPLIITQKCMLNHNFSGIKEEIWNNSSFGLLEEQSNILNNLYKVLHDVITSIIVFSENETHPVSYSDNAISIKNMVNSTNNGDLFTENKIRYSNGFRDIQYMIDNTCIQDNVSKYSLFLRNISEMDTMYQLEEQPHLTYHSGDFLISNTHNNNTGNHNYSYIANGYSNNYTNHTNSNGICGSSGNSTSQCMAERICESYFSTLYTYSLYGLISILNNYFSKDSFCSKKVQSVVNNKLFKYSPISSNYSKCSSNYYLNKRQENAFNWKYIEYFSKNKSKSSEMSSITWRSISVDSNIVNLLYKKNSHVNSCNDVVSYVPSRIPKLSIKMPDIFKQK
ncbi:hypothetical protein RS030_81192 [Cryptosporidium xiaoi]|uniref:BRCT domain-containing protein n=1 Tax=Cryptosporidium xiaoi TaxID=659607 RepID=A0AAV9XWK6_9CRYT